MSKQAGQTAAATMTKDKNRVKAQRILMRQMELLSLAEKAGLNSRIKRTFVRS